MANVVDGLFVEARDDPELRGAIRELEPRAMLFGGASEETR
jgi:hypothetical protein